jgi:predicted nucleotidyltransferase
MRRPLQDKLLDLAREYGLDAVYAFGSRAEEIAGRLTGKAVAARPASDVDIGVLPRRGTRLTARDRVRLAGKLEDLLDVGRVDLVVLPEASAFLAVDVIQGELLVDVDSDRTAEFELYVLRRGGDLLGFERRRVEAVLSEGAR